MTIMRTTYGLLYPPPRFVRTFCPIASALRSEGSLEGHGLDTPAPGMDACPPIRVSPARTRTRLHVPDTRSLS